MPTLTRRRSAHRQQCWHIYYGDVHVGTIAERVGNPHDTDPWEWSCGFYPSSHPREHQSETAATFDARAASYKVASCRLHLSLCYNGFLHRPNGTPFGPADNPAYYI